MNIGITSIIVWVAKRVVSSAVKHGKDKAERDEIVREIMQTPPVGVDWDAFERYKAEARESNKPDMGRI